MHKGRDSRDLVKIYRVLYGEFGPQHWWPAQTSLEVIVGAVLTQNTAWTNVEKAIQSLKQANVLSFKGLSRISVNRLAELIRPAGYFNIKAARLKSVIAWLMKTCQGNFRKLREIPIGVLRQMLLDVYGIGPETADSILLYALGEKSFVVDAYTKRIFSRHGFVDENQKYKDVKSFFECALPKSKKIYNEYHALIVKVGKDFCRKKPLCNVCPLESDLLKYKGQATELYA